MFGFLIIENAIDNRLHVPWAKSWYNLKIMVHIVCSALRLHSLRFFKRYVRSFSCTQSPTRLFAFAILFGVVWLPP
jgi:hypothetical protein